MSTITFPVADARRSPRFIPLAEKPPVLATETRLGIVQHTDGGEGAAFLALHGGMGGYDQSLVLAEALLGRVPACRVIAVSRPGYLGTPRASGEDAAGQADLFAALLDRLGIERAVVAAVSAGGPSAICFAARHPDRCAGLILVSAASGRFDVPESVLRRLALFERLMRVPGLLSLMAWLSGRDPDKAAARAIGDPAQVRGTLDHPEAGPLLRALLGSLSRKMAARMPGTVAETIGFADLPPLPFGEVKAPTLVIHGDADKVVPFSHGERSARQIAGAELYVVPGGGHTSLFTHLDAVRERVTAFLGA